MATLSLPKLPALLAGLASLSTPGCDRGAPRAPAAPLWVAEPRVELGQVYEGSLILHEWQLEVRADAVVSSAKTDCGCTLAELERQGPSGSAAYELGGRLLAGERLTVRVRYDTRGRRGEASRSVTLALEGGAVVPLTLGVEVLPWLLTEPPRLALMRVLEGAGAAVDFSVRSAGGEVFRLEASRAALPDWVTLALTPEAPDEAGRARAWKIRAQLGPKAPRGTFNYPLELLSDVPVPGELPEGEARTFSVTPNWTLQIVGPVALSSPNLEFGLVQGRETVSRSLRLESYEPGFEPRGATARLEPLRAGTDFPLGRTAHVNVRPSGSAAVVELTLAGLDRAVTGTFVAKLVIETGHPKLPRLEALVRGVRAPEAR